MSITMVQCLLPYLDQISKLNSGHTWDVRVMNSISHDLYGALWIINGSAAVTLLPSYIHATKRFKTQAKCARLRRNVIDTLSSIRV